MGLYAFTALIHPTASADTKVIKTTSWLSSKPACLSVVGILVAETIALEIPVNTDPDPATDAHWTPYFQDDAQVLLTATNMAVAIPVGLTIRVKKPATTNAVGVRLA